MCLYASHIFPKKAKEDIKCYKVLLTDMNSVITPIMGFEICKYRDLISSKGDIEIVPEEGFMTAFLNTIFESISSLNFSVSTGFIHSYQDFSLLIDKYNSIDFHGGGYRSELAECVIPKGTWYYDGYYCSPLDDNRYLSYSSRKLIINKIL